MFRTALLSTLLLATPVSAEVECYKRDALLTLLEKGADEKPVQMGIAANGWLVELFTNADGSTFTIAVTDPADDRTCPIVTGTDWMAAPVKLGQAS